MTITSFGFFAFIAIGAAVYYLLPKSFQWVELLLFSIIFYVLAAAPTTFVFVLISTLMAWFVTNGLEKYRQQHGSLSENRLWKTLIFLSITADVILWFVFKGEQFLIGARYLLGFLIPSVRTKKLMELTAALGMGYYTLQIIGYTLDHYWGNAEVQKNPLKLLLFTCFFPQMITGPVSRYDQLQGLYERHGFSYTDLTHGVQRILWGLFKKLVLSERCGILVDAVWSDLAAYSGFYTWAAFLLYPVQMYADFSGCMDIVIGTAEIFGIRLTENFNNPFFSASSQEFWQRWHISLGSWAKDYVLYPVLKSPWMIRLGKNLRGKFGKKAGKFLASSVGMFILWMVIGIWHGAPKYVIGVSLWYWIILMLGELIKPVTEKISARMGFRTGTFGWRFFQCTRTYLIYAVGAAFFRANGITQGFRFIKGLLRTFSGKNWNPWIFFDGGILEIGITWADINIIILAAAALFIAGLLREKYGYARIWLDRQPVLFRWGIYIALLYAVLIFGSYGPAYNAGAFIYGNF